MRWAFLKKFMTEKHKTKRKGLNMENGITIGGVSIEFTPEQLARIRDAFAESSRKGNIRLSEVQEGEIFKIGEFEFVVLEHGVQGGTAAILKEMYEADVAFGENNNFSGSNAAKVCLAFADELSDIIGAENIITHTVDLTSNDGLKDYGTMDCRASLLTTEMYRRYVYILDKYKRDCYWWLSTAYSTPAHDDARFVKCVSPSGDIYFSRFSGYALGVRPFCILKSSIFVS